MGEICFGEGITFARYMELALYHPVEGYYMGDREKIGPSGDFYTSPDVSPLFGRVLADQMEEMWRLSGSPDRWTLLEFGAGKGLLARDLLNHAAERHPEFHRATGYRIIEKSPSMALRQDQALSAARSPGRGIRWLPGLSELDPGDRSGCFFSNELLDAFPVHRVVRVGDEFREIYVACRDGSIVEYEGVLSEEALGEYLRDIGEGLEEGQVIEVSLAMREWLEDVARHLDRGFLLTIDYGDTARWLRTPDRPGGTIRSYRGHRLVDLYQSPGLQDITAHVNFTDLFRWGGEVGLKEAGYTSQTYFLLNLGIIDCLGPRTTGRGFDPVLLKETMAVKKLIMPEGMGSVFKVAAQYRGFGQKPSLTGFSGKYGSRA